MRASSVFFSAFSVLIYPAVITTTLLYLYPVFFGCEFPPPRKPRAHCYLNSSQNAKRPSAATNIAPFRLLAFGDPQLEGDSSLPNRDDSFFPGLDHLRQIDRTASLDYNYHAVRAAYQETWHRDIPLLLWSYRKRLDLWGNDYYLAHIYRTLHWWLQPTHVAVLGDLLGSQWLSNEEFENRSGRFWNRVFRGGRRVEDEVTGHGRGHIEVLGEDAAWSRRVITVPGNHDVGYAGHLSHERMERFEKQFGKTNWDVTFALPPNVNSSTQATDGITSKTASVFSGASSQPSIRLVAFNSMNLDGPVMDPSIQEKTYTYVNDAIARSPSVTRSKNTLTLVLTHIPLYKPAGVCADAEYFTYHADTGGLRAQNQLSRSASSTILEGLLGLSSNPLTPGGGLGRNGLILTGHDHEGCDVYHHASSTAPRDGEEWTAAPWESFDSRNVRAEEGTPGVREVTLRSMMGEYSGNAGMISAWFDDEAGEWRVEVAMCPAGVQHIWWGVHGLDLATVGLLLAAVVAGIFEAVGDMRARRRRSGLPVEGTPRMRSKSRNATPSERKSRGKSRTPADGHGCGSFKASDDRRARTVSRKRLKPDS